MAYHDENGGPRERVGICNIADGELKFYFGFTRVLDNLRNTIQPVHERHRNQLCLDWIDACSKSLDIPVFHDFNKEIKSKEGEREKVDANSEKPTTY